ncbi:MAG TPA: hypothetical protein DCL54_03860 [Alphaproteobacteria bacterium]|nr:hypothetical protein [Alphaproteobacteria bacterium]HAJ45700.1 hypothetical protein [Alphaproteobacteria bacterium]
MENEAIADEILSALQALLEAAGPEWTLEALGALLQEVGGGEAQPDPAAAGGPPPGAPSPGMKPPPKPGWMR